MAVKVVDKRICRGNQDVDYVEILKLTCKTTGLHTLRVKIRSNAYAIQSYARMERWDGEQWHPLCELGQGNMRTPTSLYTQNEAVHGGLEAKFAADRNELVKLAEAVIS